MTPKPYGRAFARKKYDLSVEPTPNRILSPMSLIALGLGGIIGAGIFVSVGVAAHDKAGPAVILSFGVAAIAAIAVALCYCECASSLPVAGSAYAYAYATIGEVGAWVVGWNLATCYFLAGAAVAQGWSGYFQSLLGSFHYSLPKLLSSPPFDMNPVNGHFEMTGAIGNLPALLILGVILFVVYRGVRLSVSFNNILLALKLLLLAVVVLVGVAHFQVRNWTPFAPFGYGGLTLSTGMLAAAPSAFFAFGGFEMLSVYSQECRRPHRDVPIGVIATILLITVVYIAVATAITGMVPHTQISVTAPISEAFRTIGMPWAQLLVAFGAVIGMTSVLLGVVMSLPRVLWAVGQDGLLSSRFFSTLHPKFQTPTKNILFVGITMMFLGFLLPIRFVMEFVMMATLTGYIAVCIFSILLRRSAPSKKEVFRLPFGPLIPLLGIAVCLLLLFSSPLTNWLWLGAWWGLGLMVYLFYGMRHSHLATED